MIHDSNASAAVPVRRRTTDTAMEVPTAGRALSLFGRLLRLRCPHCGRGAVLTRRLGVHARCASCGFSYERSDENYFQGAMFVNFMLGGGTFAVSFLAALLITWPNVPWNALTFGAPVVMLVYMVLLYPISKAVWLTADVMLRPVAPAELE
jgi:uncharacterized protein (DUF983 family)